jgi:hypothetical protein
MIPGALAARSPEGGEAHKSALRRLEAARVEQRRRSELHDAAQHMPSERAAASELAGANEQLAALEAWVKWVERGY